MFALVALATAINAWFLVPDLFYANRVVAGSSPGFAGDLTLHDWGTILLPWRSIPADIPGVYDLYVQVPVLAAAWGLAAGAVHFRRMSSTLRRAFVGTVGLFFIFPVMSTNTRLWNVVPSVLRSIQFPYRRQTYVVLLFAGLVIVGLLGVAENARQRPWLGALVAVLVIGVGLAEWQVWKARTYLPISASYPPAGIALAGWYDGGFYLLSVRPPILEPGGSTVAAPDPFRDSVTLTGVRTDDAGLLYSTSVVLSPLTRVEGQIRRAGGDASRRLVVAPIPGPSGSPFAGSVLGARTPAVTVGLVGTLIGLLGCAAILAWIGISARGPR